MALACSAGQLESLTAECVDNDAAVMDEACTHAVTGTDWVEGIEREWGVEFKKTPSNVGYQFGNGASRTVYGIVVPFKFGEVEYDAHFDVVKGPLPPLLGRPELMAMGMIVDHGAGQVHLPTAVGNYVSVPLKASESGHWMVPITW